MWSRRQNHRQGHIPANASLYDPRENYTLLSMYNILIFKIKKKKLDQRGLKLSWIPMVEFRKKKHLYIE